MADQREHLDHELADADRLAEEERRGYDESAPAQPPRQEPEPAPEPEPEPQRTEEPGGDDRRSQQPMVPQEALHEARRETQRLAQELAELRGHLQGLQRPPEQPEPKPDPYAELGPEPKYDDDPAAYLAWHQKRSQIDAGEIKRRQQEIDDWRQSQEEQSQQNQRFNEFMQRYQGAVVEFSANQPDWQQAYQHLLRSRDAELQLVGVPPDRRMHQIRREEAELVAAAFQAGHNPAERLYELAKQRGWSATSQQAPGNGNTPPAASETPQQPAQPSQTPARDMSGRDAARRAASRSLSDISGGPGGPLSVEDIGNMSESELLQKVDRETFRRVMGG